MAARNTPKLADLLRKFEEAQQKTAGEPVPTSGDAVPQAAPVTEPASTAPTAEKVAAAEQTKEAENQTKEAENQAGDAAGQVVDAKEALKAVTDEFVNEHTAALKKEAQIFGELFAAFLHGADEQGRRSPAGRTKCLCNDGGCSVRC